MKTNIYIALDLATKNTGYTILYDSKSYKALRMGLITSESYYSSIDVEQFTKDIYDFLHADIDEVIIVCETSAYGSNAFKFGIVLGQIIQHIYKKWNIKSKEIQLVNVVPNAWQNYFWPKNERPKNNLDTKASNRKWLKKASMERASNRREYKITSDDIADSYNMLEYYFIKQKGKDLP